MAGYLKPQEAHLLRSRLEAEGIEAFVENELTSTAWGADVLGGSTVQVAEKDLANLITSYSQNLDARGLADAATIYTTAITAIRNSEFPASKLPIIFLDVSPTSHLEQEFIRALMTQSARNARVARPSAMPWGCAGPTTWVRPVESMAIT